MRIWGLRVGKGYVDDICRIFSGYIGMLHMGFRVSKNGVQDFLECL